MKTLPLILFAALSARADNTFTNSLDIDWAKFNEDNHHYTVTNSEEYKALQATNNLLRAQLAECQGNSVSFKMTNAVWIPLTTNGFNIPCYVGTEVVTNGIKGIPGTLQTNGIYISFAILPVVSTNHYLYFMQDGKEVRL